MAEATQSFARHRRYDAWYLVATGLVLLALIMAVVNLFRHCALWPLLASLALLIMLTKVRSYALKNQDRIIRLEETLRMRALLGEDLRARIGELRPGQFVALRFASDAELADRVAEALDGQLSSLEIKKRIQLWRPDTFRV